MAGLYDPGFILTALGLVIGAVTAIIGICSGATAGAKRTVSIVLVLLGAGVGISTDATSRISSYRDKHELKERLEQQQKSQDAVLRETQILESQANRTLAAAGAINDRSQKILGITKNSAHATSVIAIKTGEIASQAGNLQRSAKATILQLDKMQTRFKNVSLFYTLTLPTSDPKLAAFYKTLATVTHLSFAASQTPDPGFISKPLFMALSPRDTGYALLASLDLQIELYKPPFPKDPPFQHVSPAGSPDLIFWTTSFDSYFGYRGISESASPPGVLAYSETPSGRLLSLRVSTDFLPVQYRRSGRLDSLADLPGSEMLIHLEPQALWSRGVDPQMLSEITLQMLDIDVDGKSYFIDLQKARTGVSFIGRWYELRLPPV